MKATNKNYPDIVKTSECYRISDGPRLNVFFYKNSVNNLPYPFKTQFSQNAHGNISRISFLTINSAVEFRNYIGSTGNIYKWGQEVTLVRIDVNGDIPCYAELEWINSFNENAINSVIRERLSKTPEKNPFEDPGKSVKQQTVQDKRQIFIDYFKSKFPNATTTDEITFNFNFKDVTPNAIFKCGEKSITFNKNNWKLYPRFEFKQKLKNIPVLNELESKIQDLWKNYTQEELYILSDKLNNISLYDNRIDIYFSEELHNRLSITILKDIVEITYSPSIYYVITPSYTKTSSLDDLISQVQQALSGEWLNLPEVREQVDKLKNLETKDVKEYIHINVKDLPEVADLPIEKNPPKQTQIDIATDFLLENFKEELVQNNLTAILNYETLDSKLDELTDSFHYANLYLTDFSFWYSFCLDELKVDIYNAGNFIKKEFWTSRGRLSLWEYTKFGYTPKSGKIFISKQALDYVVDGWTNFMPYGALIEFGEGINKLTEIRFGAGTFILPTTLTQKLNIRELIYDREKLNNILIKFKPIKDENGDLVSPFIVNKFEFEMYKNIFKAII